MKKIIFTTAAGGLAVSTPFEGSRLALAVVLADGTRLGVDGQVVAKDEEQPEAKPVPVDRIMRRWPVEGATAEWAESEDEFIARILPRLVPGGATGVRVVEPHVVLMDRTFRDAWKDAGGGVIVVDMPKAKGMHRDRLRRLRKPRLEALDVEYLRGLARSAAPAELARIESRKQLLRDAPAYPAIEAARTPEELKVAIPEALRDG